MLHLGDPMAVAAQAARIRNREDEVLDYDECWNSILRRDAARDGQFYFGVLSTGVYCRPSCPGS